MLCYALLIQSGDPHLQYTCLICQFDATACVTSSKLHKIVEHYHTYSIWLHLHKIFKPHDTYAWNVSSNLALKPSNDLKTFFYLSTFSILYYRYQLSIVTDCTSNVRESSAVLENAAKIIKLFPEQFGIPNLLIWTHEHKQNNIFQCHGIMQSNIFPVCQSELWLNQLVEVMRPEQQVWWGVSRFFCISTVFSWLYLKMRTSSLVGMWNVWHRFYL